MDPNTVIAVTAVLALILSGVGLYRDIQRSRREQEQVKQRAEWEHRQLDAAAPHLVPVGASWNGLNDTLPQRLAGTISQIEIEIHNQGNSTPLDVTAVLFPARVVNPQSGARTDNLYGIYWEGKLNASPAPGERTRLVLRQQNYPVNGDQRLLEKHSIRAR